MKAKQRFISLFLVVVMLLVLVGSSSAPSAGPVKAQGTLVQLAARSPEQMVDVIVQKAGQQGTAEAAARELGGSGLVQLDIIRAFSARMTAGAAVELAAHPDVRWVSADAAVKQTGNGEWVSPANLKTAYIGEIRADKVWKSADQRQGKGVGVAVVDSGVNWQSDLYTQMGANRVVANVRFNSDNNQTTFDNFGHGSHVAGVIGGNGRQSNGYYIGVAPQSSLINVKVSNDDGSTTTSSVVAGLQWILENKDAYNIRVVNLSLNSAEMESYHTNPLCAAVEILWFNGIVVVVSGGNNGNANLYPPANDPFVITVGSVDDKGTTAIADDSLASFSAFGRTADGISKPDLVAPGKNIVSLMGNASGLLPVTYPANKVGTAYFKMSGTSVSAPMVAGAAVLLLEDEPGLTPDQVKYRLVSTANKAWAGYQANKAGGGILDVFAAVNGSSTESANTGLQASQLLWSGDEAVAWDSVAWNSVAWNSVAWNSVAWNSVAWNSVAWNSDYWGK